MRTSTIRSAAAVLVAAALAAVAAPIASRPADAVRLPTAAKVFDANGVDCSELSPEAVAVPAGTGPAIDMLVLLDGVDDRTSLATVEVAAASYAPLGTPLRVVRTQRVTFSGTNASSLIDQTRRHVGGRRPAGTDVVMLLTAKDIEERAYPGVDPRAVVGMADCIGGIRYPQHAFAVTEARMRDEGVGRTIAHELGHLLGAHHQYANCVEGIPTEPLETTPCTLMFNAINFASRNFSTANAVVVRGHVEEFGRS